MTLNLKRARAMDQSLIKQKQTWNQKQNLLLLLLLIQVLTKLERYVDVDIKFVKIK